MSYMARLGEYTFELTTAAFQTLQRRSAYRWELVNRLGREPAAQFLGKGEETITLTGIIYPHFAGGIGQAGKMRDQAGKGEPLTLIYAFERAGQYCGRWCIREISEQRGKFIAEGLPLRIEFDVSLTYYGDDAVGAMSLPIIGQNTLAAQAGALPVVSGTAVAGDSALGTVSGFVSGLAKQAQDTASAMWSGIDSALGGSPGIAMNTIRDMQQTASYVMRLGSDTMSAVNSAKLSAKQLAGITSDFSVGIYGAGSRADLAADSLYASERSIRSIARVSDSATEAGRLQQADGLNSGGGILSGFASSCSDIASLAGMARRVISV